MTRELADMRRRTLLRRGLPTDEQILLWLYAMGCRPARTPLWKRALRARRVR